MSCRDGAVVAPGATCHMPLPAVRMGIDFDNTVVGYDDLFHRVALERNLIPVKLPATKLSVREYLRQVGKEDAWTELQGYVYGARMDDAVANPGVLTFLRWAHVAGAFVNIISHKTRHPFLGEPYDLHQAARDWIGAVLVSAAEPLIQAQDVYFEITKTAKLARIAQLELDYFIDDLPEILLDEAFPDRTGRILFDPDGMHLRDSRMVSFATWDEIAVYLESR